jgi:hypothetical protein
MDYACSLNLRGSIPQAITNKVCVPGQMHGAPAAIGFHTHIRALVAGPLVRARCLWLRTTVPLPILFPLAAVPATQQLYFQQIRPMAKCEAEDGKVVGHMLHDLVRSKPKDLPHAIREFVNRTAMLRGCGFAHIGDMLARLLSAEVQAGVQAGLDEGTTAASSSPVPTTNVGLDPPSLTKEEAIAIGTAIVLSVHEHNVPAAGMKRLVTSHAALRAMQSEFGWFVPMLEVIMAQKAAEPRASLLMKRLSSTISSVAPSDEASNADRGDEENGFSSVVRLGAQESPALTVCELVDDILRPEGLPFPLQTHGCLRRCLGMRMRAGLKRQSQPPWAWLRKARVASTEAQRCRSSECLLAATLAP